MPKKSVIFETVDLINIILVWVVYRASWGTGQYERGGATGLASCAPSRRTRRFVPGATFLVLFPRLAPRLIVMRLYSRLASCAPSRRPASAPSPQPLASGATGPFPRLALGLTVVLLVFRFLFVIGLYSPLASGATGPFPRITLGLIIVLLVFRFLFVIGLYSPLASGATGIVPRLARLVVMGLYSQLACGAPSR